eukprot:m.249448 g.249448  ORF g.249448 m.249448 type:complete len:470 (-) comp54499_c1_seq16:3449-4858(-)
MTEVASGPSARGDELPTGVLRKLPSAADVSLADISLADIHPEAHAEIQTPFQSGHGDDRSDDQHFEPATKAEKPERIEQTEQKPAPRNVAQPTEPHGQGSLKMQPRVPRKTLFDHLVTDQDDAERRSSDQLGSQPTADQLSDDPGPCPSDQAHEAAHGHTETTRRPPKRPHPPSRSVSHTAAEEERKTAGTKLPRGTLFHAGLSEEPDMAPTAPARPPPPKRTQTTRNASPPQQSRRETEFEPDAEEEPQAPLQTSPASLIGSKKSSFKQFQVARTHQLAEAELTEANAHLQVLRRRKSEESDVLIREDPKPANLTQDSVAPAENLDQDDGFHRWPDADDTHGGVNTSAETVNSDQEDGNVTPVDWTAMTPSLRVLLSPRGSALSLTPDETTPRTKQGWLKKKGSITDSVHNYPAVSSFLHFPGPFFLPALRLPSCRWWFRVIFSHQLEASVVHLERWLAYISKRSQRL